MRKSRLLLTACALAGSVVGGCSQTIYDFFPAVGSGGGTDGPCVSTECTPGAGGTGGGATTDTGTSEGGSGATTETTSTGETGYAGAPNADSCTSMAMPGEPLRMLRFTQSGNCLGRGVFTLLGTDPGYVAEAHPCTQRPRDAWVEVEQVTEQGIEAHSYLNESVGMNLDVRYAAPTAGTPLVLYAPHPAYNQHFTQTSTTEGDFLLSPLHASTMCLTEVNGAVEIWPCNPAAPTQHLELVDCMDIAP